MYNSKKLIEIIYKFVSNIKDEDLESLLNGESELILKQKVKKQNKNVEKSKNKKLSLNLNNIEEIYNKIRTSDNREEAKKILLSYKLTKVDLLEFGTLLNVNLPKSATKDKIIDKIIDITVGWNVDRSTISEVKLK